MSKTMLWAVVQHSGFGYKNDPGFKKGLELRNVTAKDAERIKAAGGVVFDTYTEADEYAFVEMYPEGASGLYPQARGAFSKRVVDGLRIYLPTDSGGAN